MEKNIDNLQHYFYNNPSVFGLFFAGLGMVFLLGAIFNWDWVFEPGGGTYTWAHIIKYLGRNFARVIMAIIALVMIICGVFYYFFYTK